MRNGSEYGGKLYREKVKMAPRAEPDDIGSQLFYFVKMTDHAFQISDAVPVGILKTLRINLISDRFVPPLFLHYSSPVLLFS